MYFVKPVVCRWILSYPRRLSYLLPIRSRLNWLCQQFSREKLLLTPFAMKIAYIKILIWRRKTKGTLRKINSIFSYPLWFFIPLLLFMVRVGDILDWKNVMGSWNRFFLLLFCNNAKGVFRPLKNVAFPKWMWLQGDHSCLSPPLINRIRFEGNL